MAVTFTQQLQNMTLLIEQAMHESISASQMRGIAEIAVDEIRTRTRLGYGVPTPNGPRQPLARLDDKSTIPNRKRLKIEGKLSNLTSPGKSNLTATGQLLDSIQVEAVSEGRASIQLTGQRREGNLSNEQLGEFHQQGTKNMPAHPFMGLTDLQIRRITETLRRDLVSRVNKALTKVR